ncbi:hypothetical protein [Moritella sp. F3]|uniref:hypothetical protein n=1 Tax=Moritella sp. F3 TaxID=2718882 RepID=UPI0018E1A03D|nr:hypothetical protein [Moritella sp. F3]GIC77051.1 hypothetical protein FMO001_17780 [Moritella sp. F1]GIC82170.1 hypothetical protein FMO003_24510 [Moritella sp. F3]
MFSFLTTKFDLFNKNKVASLKIELEAQKKLLEESQNKLMPLEHFFENVYIYAGTYPNWKVQQELRESNYYLKQHGAAFYHFKTIDKYLTRLVDATQEYVTSNRADLNGPERFWQEGLSEARGDDMLTPTSNKKSPQLKQKNEPLIEHRKVMYPQKDVHITMAFSNLIADVLRVPNTAKFDAEHLQIYVHEAGVALHNLPECILEKRLSSYELIKLNLLDPTGSDTKWGDWSTQFALAFDLKLPDVPVSYQDEKKQKQLQATANLGAEI